MMTLHFLILRFEIFTFRAVFDKISKDFGRRVGYDRISGHDTNRITDVTIRFLFSSWFFDTFKLPIGNILRKDEENMKEKRKLLTGGGLIGVFVLWTVLVCCVDVQAVGQNGTKIGFARFNVWFHQLTGVHMTIYTITDWLGLVPIFICLCFGMLGLVQLIKRRSLRKVDPDILLLGGYYVLVIACYLIFEMIPINYRPVLIEGRLEASYPSSTTLLVLSVMPTLRFQANRRTDNIMIRRWTTVFVIAFSAFMVAGRLIAGVHWATDIIGSVLASAGMFMLYESAVAYTDRAKNAGRSKDGVQ